MSDFRTHEVTQLLLAWSDGDEASLEELLPLVYEELRHLAQHTFRHEWSAHTLQATELVHEAYLRLVDQRQVRWENRAHFFGVAARLMRQIMVDHARSSRAQKRGGGHKLALEEELVGGTAAPDVDLIALDDALQRLAARDPRQSRIVELRFFAGLTHEETAAALGISRATVKREWSMAKAWLYGEIVAGER